MKRTLFLGVLIGACLISSLALAQYGDPPPPPPPPGAAPPPAPPPPPPGYYNQQPPGLVRDGLMIGVSLGGGTISADCDPSVDCSDSGVFLSFNIGGMLTPKLALMLDASAIGVPLEYDYTLTHAVSTVALQAWLTDHFWLKGGLGIGRFSLTDPDGNSQESDNGGAVMVGAGYELMQGQSFVLDVQLRAAVVRYDVGNSTESFTNGSLSIGANWY